MVLYFKKENVKISHKRCTLKDTKSFKSLTYISLPGLNMTFFKTTNTLLKIVKTRRIKSTGPGRSCRLCPKRYIGQTGRTFEKRINEHKRSFFG